MTPTRDESSCAAVLRELIERETTLLRPARTLARPDLARSIDPAFLELGASGRRYGREEALDVIERRRDDPDSAWLDAGDFECTELAADCFLLVYAIRGPRPSNRSSIWVRRDGEWRIVFHQGTIATP